MPAARADSVESPTLVEGIGDELAVAAAATAAGGVALLCWARSSVGGQFVHQMQQEAVDSIRAQLAGRAGRLGADAAAEGAERRRLPRTESGTPCPICLGQVQGRAADSGGPGVPGL